MANSVQYLMQPDSEKRLVVITEDHYLSLLDRTSERQGISVQNAEHSLPDQVVSRIKAGENPLAVLRSRRGLNGRQLARILGISPSMVSQMERHWKFGSTKTMIRLADVLGIPIELLLHNEYAADANRRNGEQAASNGAPRPSAAHETETSLQLA